MTDATSPAPGWYPDPEDVGRYLRYWDGEQWTVRQLLPQGPSPYVVQPVQRDDPRKPLGAGFRRLGQVVGVGLVLVTLTSLGQLALHVWGVGMVDDAVAIGDLDRLNRYDGLEQLTSGVLLVLLFVIGVCWMAWQYRLAKDVGPNAVRRTPPWHAWSWVIPFGNFWLPFQNVRDLLRHLQPDRRAGWLRLWWACWLLANLIGWFLARSPEDASVDTFKGTTTADAVSDALLVVAGILAIRLVRTLTSAGLARSAAEVNAAASPAA